MEQVMLFLLLVVINAFCQHNCTFQAEYNGSDSKYSDLLKSIINITESYVFLDNARSSPATLRKPYVDLTHQLRGINPNKFHTEEDFYMCLIDIFKSLNDPHTAFVPPCYGLFHYALPYSFHPELDPANNSNVIVRLRATLLSNVTEYWHNSVGKQNLLGKIVKSISLTGEKADLRDARQVLQEFADKQVHYSRSPAARLNRAIQRDFHLRQASRFRFPGQYILIEWVDESNRSATNFERLNWFGYVLAESLNAASFCPSFTFLPPPNSSVGANHQSNDWSDMALAAKRTQALSLEELLNPVEDLYQMTAKVDREIGGLVGFRRVDYERFKGKRSHPPETGSFDQKDETAFMEEMMEERTDLSVGFRGSSIAYTYNKTTDVFYLQIRSFEFDADSKTSIKSALFSILHDNPEKLILDLRSNSGGLIQYGMELFQFLFPQSIPLAGIYHFRNSTFPSVTMDRLGWFTYGVQYTPANATFTFPELIENSIPYRFIENERNLSYTKNYSLPFQKTFHRYGLIPSWIWKMWADRVEYIGNLFRPENVIVLTDGVCGSLCACLAKKIEADHLGKVVGIGGAPLWSKDGPRDVASWTGWRDEYDVGSFAGGMVMYYHLPIVYNQTGNSTAQTQVAHISLTLLGIFNWGDRPEFYNRTVLDHLHLQEFKVSPADDILPDIYPDETFDSTKEGQQAIIQRLLPFFTKHYYWEIEPDTSCGVNATDPYRVHGHPFVNGSFNLMACQLGACLDGYVPVQDRQGNWTQRFTCLPREKISEWQRLWNETLHPNNSVPYQRRKEDEEMKKKKDEEIKKKDEEMKKKDEEIKKKDEEMKKKDEEMKKKDEEAKKSNHTIEKLEEEMKKKDEEMKKKDEEMKKKDEEMKKMKEALQDYMRKEKKKNDPAIKPEL